MAKDITVNFSGLDGDVFALEVAAWYTVADLKLRLEARIGAVSAPYLRLLHGSHILQDSTVLADAVGHDASHVDLSIMKLKGPEVLDYKHFDQFVTAVGSEEQPTTIPFCLECLRVLNLSGKPGWMEELLCNEYPGSDCVKEICNFSAFISALREMHSLTELDLSGNAINSQSIDPEEDFPEANPCVDLGEALPRTLEVLVLAHSGWWSSGELEFLATGLARGTPLVHLRELRFARSSNFYTRGDMDAISRNLAKGICKLSSYMPALEKLSIEACSLRHEHLSELSLPKSIRSLNLLRNFCIDEGSTCSNVEALVAELPNLAELQLSVSKASDDCAACCSLRKSVPKGCKVEFVALTSSASIATPVTSNSEPLQGLWTSSNGEINIFEDKMTGQLTYAEFIGDGSDCIRGHLKPDGQYEWLGELMLIEDGEEPWYGPSCGEKPETVGEVRVTLCSAIGSKQLELRIRAPDEDWAAPVLFQSAD